MVSVSSTIFGVFCLPSHEGSGLKCLVGMVQIVNICLPSHEGSGLKCKSQTCGC